jgi:hypothetical protein
MKFINQLFSIAFITFLFVSCDDDGPGYQEPYDPNQNNQLTETEMLNLVQKQSITYFWDHANANSKLARERFHPDDPNSDMNTVTTGGSGFGLLNILVGIERGSFTRTSAVTRLQTALNFLETADRFHGAWPHWMNGTNGDVIPFGNIDNGGDLVETAFLCQGLICVREYFKNGNETEQALAQKADLLWKGVEWDWYTKGENALYWHWSPDHAWQINMKLIGYNETMISYILGASSPTHPISSDCYEQTWAQNGSIVTSATKYGVPVVFNHAGASGSVGPMFFSHYSFLALDPRGLTDQYANYWDLTKNHATIMQKYCIANPGSYYAYSDKVWGLTASYSRNADGSLGYNAHSPQNDVGVISPTAALSNFPYTPTESMKFLKYLYQEKRDAFVGVCGPYDAISPHYSDWKVKGYLAIDQGTIAPMIENYRTGLLWNLFMNAPEIKQGLINMGFHSTQYGF